MRYKTFQIPTIEELCNLTTYLFRTFHDYKVNEKNITITLPVIELNEKVLNRIKVAQNQLSTTGGHY